MTSVRGTILAVFAHPDDESFGAGGTLALYARRGYTVILVCATRGEAGTVDPQFLRGFESVAQLREAELRCAAQHLGIQAVHFLGYRDSGMPNTADNLHPDAQVRHPIEQVAGRIVRHIREIRPDVVITFDPIGGYRHPDHIHVHQATTLAFQHAADPAFHPESGAAFQPRALYYHVLPLELLRIATRVMPLFGIDPRRWGRNKDVDLKALTKLEFPRHVRVDVSRALEAKGRASACHASQGGMQMRHGLMAMITRLMGPFESYMRAYPSVNGQHRPLGDLFEGI